LIKSPKHDDAVGFAALLPGAVEGGRGIFRGDGVALSSAMVLTISLSGKHSTETKGNETKRKFF
jgi:hypothetical protein